MTATPARAGLDELDALLAAATPGPWQYDDGMAWDSDPDYPEILARFDHDADAALIVALRNRAPAMVAAIRAAYTLHVPIDRGTGPQCQGCATHVTFTPWPCPTVAVLNEALEVAK